MSRSRDDELAEILAEVRRIEVHSARLVAGVMAGEYGSVFRGSGIEFDEVREYVEGDDPRAVDWNVTARVGRPFVKQYVDERHRTVLFLLDLSDSMAAGGFGAWSARGTAARVCACLALSAVQNEDHVGLVAFSDRVDHLVPPRKGVRHALRIVRDCLAIPGRGGRTDLAAALDVASRIVRRHAIVFVVSDFLTDGWQSAMTRCSRLHDVVAIRIVGPEQDPPPVRGLVRVRDPESGRTSLVDFGSERVRDAYAKRVRAWREGTEQSLRRAGVDRMDVPVPKTADTAAIVRPILGFFRMRELRGAKR